jgi:hypothetical protein
MSGDVINLRMARKDRERQAKEKEAAQNRRAFGETKGEREHQHLSAEKASRHLDAHRLEASGEPSASVDDKC